MSEQTTTTPTSTPAAPQASEAPSPASAAPAAAEAQASPAEASGAAQGAAEKPFDMAAWQASGGARSELPEGMRGLYDHLSDDFAKRDSFNAVKELREMIEQADKSGQQRSGVYDDTPKADSKSDLEQQVQARLAQMKNQESVQKFRGDFESMLKAPIQVGDGHSFAFANKGELEKFVNYSRDVLQNGRITPMDLYKLYNFERILADTGEWKARQHEEALRKTAGGPRGSESTQTQAKTSDASKSSAGERDSNLTVEEIMQQKFHEIFGNMKSGNVRYG